ncbi:unnamed protein product [Strongylus vulgaris]|uniref:Uncharacterized protein n=1 Tax=Strongylus vulgaris TaxID=40348 RepID=A0A3P7JDY7_STRVU|nr:unnamed protein product [Strongylus vulgaris]
MEVSEPDDDDGYRTPERATLFTNTAVSLYGLDEDTIKKLS